MLAIYRSIRNFFLSKKEHMKNHFVVFSVLLRREDIIKQIENPYLVPVFLSTPFNKLPCPGSLQAICVRFICKRREKSVLRLPLVILFQLDTPELCTVHFVTISCLFRDI